jgi:hypothetical protein
VAPSVAGEHGVVLFRDQEPLLRNATFACCPSLKRWYYLHVTVPVSFLSPSGEHYALPSSRVVQDHLQQGLSEQTALMPPVAE